MRIRVPQPSASPAAESSEDTPEQLTDEVLWGVAGTDTVELLCTVRALLKKMKQRVFVGDFVKVINIDWTSNQGTPFATHNHTWLILNFIPVPK